MYLCIALLIHTLTGHENRVGEADAMLAVMRNLDLKVVQMTAPAKMDGGDVLFTGREFFVGLSQRTNEVQYLLC